ncbi:uncharacterized protein LOC122532806, partial [Frieseomelitta varia]|uniref:uncharacterized protein LOC122532806 n=1 Tax=Frieseomelitta varia TaxID=561572 RepID=UPI001CB6AA47
FKFNVFESRNQSKLELVFQKTDYNEIFHVPYYKNITKFMKLLGQDPRDKSSTKSMIVIIVTTSIVSIILPTIIELYVSLRKKDADGVIECLPHFIASSIGLIKILNMHFNRQNFSKLFHLVGTQWDQLKLSGQLHVLEKIVIQGNKMAQFYHNTLVSFLILYLLIPLISPILDIIHPLNETRTRQQILRVNYLFFDGYDYFFYSYLQLLWAVSVTVFTIIGADWLYMLIIHHNSGLFTVCGYQIQKVVSIQNYNDEVISQNYIYEKSRNSVLMHKEAIGFFMLLDKSSQISYLIQVGLNMLGMSATAVQTVVNIHRPEIAMRNAVFCGASQFHLLLLSLPGQVLLDSCSTLADNIYNSAWYATPVKIQKLLYVMQIRCKKLCSLTAGGLYDMNIENFGIAFKTCMSYITMMMSLRD